MARPGSIGFIGFGEAGRAFAASLKPVAPGTGFHAYDIKQTGPDADDMRGAMEAAGVFMTESAEQLGKTDWIVSAVTADRSLEAIRPILPALRAGHVVIDINSVSPGRKRETAALVEGTGAAYLDMAVMAPVHPRGHATPVLIAGAQASAIAGDLRELGFDVGIAGGKPGEATAIKMVRSLFVKGLEAITVETLLAARASGCFDDILSSLSASYPGLGLPDFANYQFERTLTHGARRAAEMEECAATLDQLGLSAELAASIAGVQRKQGIAGPESLQENRLAELVDRTLRNRLKSG